MLILTLMGASPALAASAKAPPKAKAEPCVTDYLAARDQFSPEQIAALEGFEKLASGPMVPTKWSSVGGTSVEVVAEPGKILVKIYALPKDKFVFTLNDKMPGAQTVKDAINARLQGMQTQMDNGGFNFPVSLCKVKDDLYMNPLVPDGYRINLSPTEDNSAITISVNPPGVTFSDIVTKVTKAAP